MSATGLEKSNMSRSPSVEMQSPGTPSIPLQRRTSGSLNSPSPVQHCSRVSSGVFQSTLCYFIPRQRSASSSPMSLYNMSPKGVANSNISRPPFVQMQLPGTPSNQMERHTLRLWNSPASGQNHLRFLSVGFQSPPLSVIHRQRSTSNSRESLDNMSATGFSNPNISMDKTVTDSGSSESNGGSSEDQNFEYLMQEANNYEFGDDEDWDNVVYQGPSRDRQTQILI
ncbi:uncharacterized protein MELLADRAFT_62373 [Melampsora larici-populina 98AG31]|uniref:Uncharacterized protein n=1 Tax=Melampsora larici-populina (strain 98AG31 / pathotype 3-4-7) TaxID=747676 RepID=F4RIR2_MELLP|nr:uncharacterized protein MELLADRAFT_62373 [Melampsora larici-populina 98AG31]EGG07606.1 hypothetical protein MELLADRAFT_62373 [Melampsora larici-populina 98AG31]